MTEHTGAGAGAAPSTSIGPYRIEREIGRGGMGVVYLARDSRLDRRVALKALPADVAADPDRLARFEREAKILAQISHPNVAAIYDVEDVGGARYLALEYIEGESLAERLSRGPLPLAEALDLCQQIAAGMEAAHEGGIIHRDLKPGNVVIAAGDVVKVVDFGLAKGKVAGEGGDDSGLAHSPTMLQSPTLAASPTILRSPTMASPGAGTMPGMILGTAAYLSPEQARGKPVDRRTDIWAFGCVLYECLAGKLTFSGETASDTIAKILERDVDWGALPPGTPPAVRALLGRCLEKDPRKRLRDIGEARLAIEAVKAGANSGMLGMAPASAGGSDRRGVPWPWIAGALGVLAVAALAFGALGGFGGGVSPRSFATGPRFFSLDFPPDLIFQGASFSRSGSSFAMIGIPRKSAGTEDAQGLIYVRPFDRPRFEAIPGTEGATQLQGRNDGRWLFYLARASERSDNLRLRKVPLDGSGPPVDVMPWKKEWTNGILILEGERLFIIAPDSKSYSLVPINGTPPPKPTPIQLPKADARFQPQDPLPGGRGLLVTLTSYEGDVYTQSIGVLDFKTNRLRVILADGGSPRLVHGRTLVFTRGPTLLAVPFDLDRLEPRGEPVALFSGIRTFQTFAHGQALITEDGTLFYPPGGREGSDQVPVLVDASGHEEEWSGEKLACEQEMMPSPDGKRFATVIANDNALDEIWTAERGKPARRTIAVPGADVIEAIWSPDGSQIAFSQFARKGTDGVYIANADGTGVPRYVAAAGDPETVLIATDWTRDGHLLLMTQKAGKLGIAVAAIPPAGSPPAAPTPLFSDGVPRARARLNPSGTWLGFISSEGRRNLLMVAPWAGGAVAGAAVPLVENEAVRFGWSVDGKSLAYEGPDHKIRRVSLAIAPGAVTAASQLVAWDLQALRLVYDISTNTLSDGRLLAVRQGELGSEVTRIDVALGFGDAIDRKMKEAASKP